MDRPRSPRRGDDFAKASAYRGALILARGSNLVR